jgi:hypothetical protein
MNWQRKLKGETLSWLLEENNPGVRYLAMRDLLKLPSDNPELISAKEIAHREGPISIIMDTMRPEGYWVTPGPGYSCKYKSAVWSLILLAQLGASVDMDERIGRACRYLMDHALTEYGQFSTDGTTSGTIDCLHGNMCAALLDMGYQDFRLEQALDWMGRSVTGEGIAPLEDKRASRRYYPSQCGPVFACGHNNRLSCAWGGAKVLLALGKIPPEFRTPQIERAITTAMDFFLVIDPLLADYPTRLGRKPSPNWWNFGFPVFYVTDILQILEAFAGLGLLNEPRLVNALEYVRNKQDQNGRWALEYDYKTWVDFGPKKQPNKWVTYRAEKVLMQSNIT